MGQFKPMVKMMTTEPSVELKLKKGGKVEKPKKMMDGGAMGRAVAPALARAAMAAAPMGRGPARPSMADRRRAMMGRPMMAEGGETKAEHKAEMKTMSQTAKKLKEHAAMPASKAHKGLKTGGVAMGQGGYKSGGSVDKSGVISVAASERGAEGYKNTKMHTAEYTGKTSGKTGEVKKGNAGGYKHGGKAKKMMGGGSCYAEGGGVKGMGVMNNVSTSKPGATNTTTGGVRLGNAGGYKKGGASKKFAEGGSVKIARGGLNDAGKPEAMPQGNKTPPTPVSINRLSGTYKKGGTVKKAGGGLVTDREQRMLDKAYEESLGPSKAEMDMARTIRDIPGKLFRGAKSMLGMDRKPGAGSVTETEKSVTVTPAKKRGGSVKC